MPAGEITAWGEPQVTERAEVAEPKVTAGQLRAQRTAERIVQDCTPEQCRAVADDTLRLRIENDWWRRCPRKASQQRAPVTQLRAAGEVSQRERGAVGGDGMKARCIGQRPLHLRLEVG